VAGAHTIAETADRVFEDTADGIVVLSSMTIAAAKEMVVSLAFLDLLRQASEKDPEWQVTRDAVLRKNKNVEVQDNLLHHGNRWVISHGPALKLRIRSQNHDSKVAGHFGQLETTEHG
jgi:hypothetical protein